MENPSKQCRLEFNFRQQQFHMAGLHEGPKHEWYVVIEKIPEPVAHDFLEFMAVKMEADEDALFTLDMVRACLHEWL